MTLAQRLMIATGVLTIAVTAALGFGVREAWRDTEERRFREQFRPAVQGLERELKKAASELQGKIAPLCRHDPMVDRTLVDLRTGRLDRSRRLALSLVVPEQMKSLGVDELYLVTGKGEILGAGHAKGLTGKRDPELLARMKQPTEKARLRSAQPPLALEAHCMRSDGGAAVGVYAARYLDPLLESTAAAHDLKLSLTPPDRGSDVMLERVQLEDLGITLTATRSRVPLHRALQQLDSTIFAIGGGTLGAALLLAMLLSRGLARPIADLARQARVVARGEPQPVKARGPRELKELADSYNTAIADLARLRKRLAATERIAARREIARRVAHEIKNPLAPIRAAVETLRRLRARDDPAFDEYFDEATRTVLDEVTRISNIVTEFTRFARLPPPEPAPMDLGETLRKVAGLHATERADVRIHIARCPLVNADKDQMVQVVTNLLQNALDAVAAREGAKVVLELEPDGAEHVALRVTDNGPGLAANMRDRLFEPYATTKSEGTGLGLAIVHRIVAEHAGEIRYEDAPSGGARFVVQLPVDGPGLLPEPPTSTPLHPPSR